jgi:hypothetical protein
MKLFGATAASAAASKVLAGLPEAEPKIALLEPKEIITDIHSDVSVIKHVINYSKTTDNNLRVMGECVREGWRMVELSATIYMENIAGGIATDTGYLPLADCVVFENPEELRGEKYRITEARVTACAGSFVTAEVHGILVHTDDTYRWRSI